MRTQRNALLCVIIVLATLPLWGQEDVKPEYLTLQGCIVRAVKHNLGVTVQVYNAELADLAVSRSREKFLPILDFALGKKNQNSASYSWTDAAGQASTSYMDYSGILSQAVPWGGQFSASLVLYKNTTNARYLTINPRYGSTLTLSFSQPLLRDFGYKTSRKDILAARNNRDIAESDLKQALLETVYSAEQSYWQLVLSMESLKVRLQSLKLAEDLLDQSLKKVNIGTLAPKEILSVQSDVASRRAEILQAKSQVKDNSDSLRALLNALDPKGGGEIIPTDTPPFLKYEISLEEAFATALDNRPDLMSCKFGIRNRELDYSYARNQSLPALDLTASYWSPGISGDRILYLNDNPLTGVIIGTQPRGPSLAMRDSLHFAYENWSISLALNIPMNTVFSRAAEAQAKVNLDQELALMKKAEQQAYLEIRTTVRAIQTNHDRVEAYRTARELAEQTLAAEESKLEAGLSTTFIVLTYQRDLASSRQLELSALVDHTLSIAQLEKAMGTSLQKRNIKLIDALEERL